MAEDRGIAVDRLRKLAKLLEQEDARRADSDRKELIRSIERLRSDLDRSRGALLDIEERIDDGWKLPHGWGYPRENEPQLKLEPMPIEWEEPSGRRDVYVGATIVLFFILAILLIGKFLRYWA